MTRPTYSVSELTAEIRETLEASLGEIVVRGEVSGFRVTKGRLVYFELKDATSRILCFVLTHELPTILDDGTEVQALCTPSVFLKTGGLHLRVHEVELMGTGALMKTLLALREKLSREGLFDSSRKRSLPTFPRRIGLVTSPDAAAYTDVLQVLRQRWPLSVVRFTPTSVQGVGSVREIVAALRAVGHPDVCDVVTLTRGGGSLEDLQSFNAEEVARAIAASRVPVVVGVGHERDVTIADDVADLRASTPSNAAERTVPDRADVLLQIQSAETSIDRSLAVALNAVRARLQASSASILQAFRRVRERAQELERALVRGFGSIRRTISEHERRRTAVVATTRTAFRTVLTTAGQRRDALSRILQSYSPRATLRRGYSITRTLSGRVVRTAERVRRGEHLETLLGRGTLRTTVTQTYPDPHVDESEED